MSYAVATRGLGASIEVRGPTRTPVTAPSGFMPADATASESLEFYTRLPISMKLRRRLVVDAEEEAMSYSLGLTPSGLGLVPGTTFVSYQELHDALGGDVDALQNGWVLPLGSTIHMEPCAGALCVRVHWRKPDGLNGFWDATFVTVDERRAAYAAQDRLASGVQKPQAPVFIDQPWLPYAAGGVLLFAVVGFFMWRQR